MIGISTENLTTPTWRITSLKRTAVCSSTTTKPHHFSMYPMIEIIVEMMNAFIFINLFVIYETIGIIIAAVANAPKIENIAGTVPAIS